MTQSTPQSEIVHAISREALAALPIHRYEGEVCVVTTLADADYALADLRTETIVGFDTETRPAFSKGESHLPCLVQAATARKVYLFQLRRLQAYEVLRELLEAVGTLKVGVALRNDLRALKSLFPFAEANVLDLESLARRRRLKQTGLRNLAGIFLGVRIPKGARTTNWETPRLNSAQITYAATDAWVCRELFLRFQSLGMLEDKHSRSGAEPANINPGGTR